MMVYNAVLLEAGVSPRTGWNYPRDVLKDITKHKRVHGELSPSHDLHDTHVEVDIHNISHEVTNLRYEHGSLYGDVHFFDTPAGKIAQSLYPDSVTLVPRGTGDIDKNKNITNYNLIAFDFINKI